MRFKATLTRLIDSPIQLLILLAGLQLIVSLLTSGFALSFDESIWQYIGRNWFRHGLTPYEGGVDNKSPYIFAIYGLSDRLFGVNYWFPRIFATLFESFGVYFVYRIGKHLGGKGAGLFALSLYGLSLLWKSTDGKWVSVTETYEVCFLLASIWRFLSAHRPKDYLVSGILASLGIAFRISGLFPFIALLLASFRKGAKPGLALVGGTLVGASASIAILLLAGIHPTEMIQFGLTENFGAGSTTDHSLLWRLENFADKFFYSELILFYPLLIAYGLYKKKLDLFWSWLIWVFVGIHLTGIYDRAHLKEILPPLSLMGGWALAESIRRFKLAERKVLLWVWILFFPKLIEPAVSAKNGLAAARKDANLSCDPPFTQPNDGERKRLGQWIESVTPDRERVLVAGFGAQVQAYSERRSPTIYFNATQTRVAEKVFQRQVLAQEPDLILVPRFPEYSRDVDPMLRNFIDSLVLRDYGLDSCQFGYSVYRRRAP
jgi:hypothetical protein